MPGSTDSTDPWAEAIAIGEAMIGRATRAQGPSGRVSRTWPTGRTNKAQAWAEAIARLPNGAVTSALGQRLCQSAELARAALAELGAVVVLCLADAAHEPPPQAVLTATRQQRLQHAGPARAVIAIARGLELANAATWPRLGGRLVAPHLCDGARWYLRSLGVPNHDLQYPEVTWPESVILDLLGAQR